MDWGGQMACLIGWGSPFDADDHTYKVFGTDKGANYSGYSNAEVDELPDARRASPPTRRSAASSITTKFQDGSGRRSRPMPSSATSTRTTSPSTVCRASRRIPYMGHHGVGIFWNVREWTLD